MIRVLTFAVAALLVGFVFTAGVAARPHRGGAVACPSAGARTVVADAQANVFAIPDPIATGTNGPAFTYRGCVYGHRSFLIGGTGGGSAQGGSLFGHLTLAGVFVADLNGYASTLPIQGLSATTAFYVEVRNLRTGRRVRLLPTGDGSTYHRPGEKLIGVGPAVAIVLNSDGSVAWIAQNEIIPSAGGPIYEVHAANSAGNRLLASGADIDPTSLALGGGTLYWTQGRHPASVPLR